MSTSMYFWDILFIVESKEERTECKNQGHKEKKNARVQGKDVGCKA